MVAEGSGGWIDDWIDEDARRTLGMAQAQHEEILKTTAEAGMD